MAAFSVTRRSMCSAAPLFDGLSRLDEGAHLQRSAAAAHKGAAKSQWGPAAARRATSTLGDGRAIRPGLVSVLSRARVDAHGDT